ncbi:MAG TPA: P1 family peptidase [bacterium]|nr:P1 family peptidase [bacterium]
MITDVAGITVGHATDLEHLTGCTAVVCGDGAVGGVAVLGGAPGTRETDSLRPENLVDRVHAILLCGGSAFGLAAADGAIRYLEAQGVGFPTPAARVPLVPAAVIYDLGIGSAGVRPDAAMGEAACRAARPGPVGEGCVGAGTGATVGKLFGLRGAMKSGIGTWGTRVAGGATVAALVVTNAFGDVLDVRTGKVLAGARHPDHGGFVGTAGYLRTHGFPEGHGFPFGVPAHTTIGVVATNAALTKAQATRLALLAHAGLARAVSPSHTSVDGDAFFVVSTRDAKADWFALQAAVPEAVAEAVMRSVRAARTLGGVPGLAP